MHPLAQFMEIQKLFPLKENFKLNPKKSLCKNKNTK